MSLVWAPFKAPGVGLWADHAYQTGWDVTIMFSSLDDLLGQMESRNLRGKVARLGVVAHGDRQGLVRLDRELTVQTVTSFERELHRLRWFLPKDGMLEFYSCVAGAHAEGSELLNALSSRLPGRTVVGFTLWGETDASENLSGLSEQAPGMVREAPHGKGSGRKGREGLLTPWHPAAKWSRNGMIVRAAPLERGAQNRCASPQCPGHASPLHHCERWMTIPGGR